MVRRQIPSPPNAGSFDTMELALSFAVREEQRGKGVLPSIHLDLLLSSRQFYKNKSSTLLLKKEFI